MKFPQSTRWTISMQHYVQTFMIRTSWVRGSVGQPDQENGGMLQLVGWKAFLPAKLELKIFSWVQDGSKAKWRWLVIGRLLKHKKVTD